MPTSAICGGRRTAYGFPARRRPSAASMRKGWPVVVVTNQSGVARGYYREADVRALHAWMNEALAALGAHIDAFYYCPHHLKGTVPEYKVEC